YLIRDFLKYLAGQPDQERYAALGSGQHVKVPKRFQRKAKKGLELANLALAAGSTENANAQWRRLLGRGFPLPAAQVQEMAFIGDAGKYAKNTEQFIEDIFPVDIRYSIRLECEVSQNGFRGFLIKASRKLNAGI